MNERKKIPAPHFKSGWVLLGQLWEGSLRTHEPLFLSHYSLIMKLYSTLNIHWLVPCNAKLGRFSSSFFLHLYIWSGDFCSIGVLVTSTVFGRWGEEREAAGWIAFRLLKPALVCSGWRWREILRGVHTEILMCRLSSSFIAGGLTKFNPTVHITNEYYSFQTLLPDIDWLQRSG